VGPDGVIYVVAMRKNGSGTYFQRLHALDLGTGAELFGGPQDIQATFPGTGDNSQNGMVVFDPAQYKEMAALLLLNGRVYTSWSAHFDSRPYTSWIISYDEATLAQTSVINLTPNANGGSFWNSGGGLAADSDGNIYQMLANGIFDTTLNGNGFPNKGDYANAFVKLSTARSLTVADYFAMSNIASENGFDVDLGSGSALLLPDMADAQGQTRHLAVGAGKDGNIYLLNRDNMGKFNPNNNNSNAYQVSSGLPSSYCTPAYFNGYIYFGPIAFPFSNARLGTPPAFASFIYTASISSNGATNGIVWGARGKLSALDASSLNPLYDSDQAPNGRDSFGPGIKFITPTIANGKVYIGAQNVVGVFGLLP